MKHTPTPWKTIKPFHCGNKNFQVWGKDGNTTVVIAECLYDGLESYEYFPQEENAAFIVEACNAYEGLNATIDTLAVCVERIQKERDALLEAARAARAHITSPHHDKPSECGIIETLDKAIALCDGEGE